MLPRNENRKNIGLISDMIYTVGGGFNRPGFSTKYEANARLGSVNQALERYCPQQLLRWQSDIVTSPMVKKGTGWRLS
jgi:hypothetical protein